MFKPAVWACVACLPLLWPVSASAQVKPSVVVSLAPLEEQLSDIMYVAEAVGQKDQAQAITGFAPLLLNGIDMKRPLGAYAILSAGEPAVVVFVPVTNLATVLQTHEDKIGKPEDLGGGVLKFETPGQSVFIKEQTGWAFVSNSQENLKTLPADPLTILGEAPKKHNLAIQVNVQDIPEQLRNMAISQMEAGLAAGLQNNPGGADEEFNRQWGQMSLTQIKRLIQEVNSLTIGWNIDPAAKQINVDAEIVPVANTGMARQAAMLKDCTSKFSGFLMQGSAVNGLTSADISPEDIEANVKMLSLFQGRAEKEIDNDAGLDADTRAKAKEVIGDVFGMLIDSVKAGKMDYGATLLLGDKSVNFAAGVAVADGKKLETAFGKLVELAKNEADFPEVKLNSGTHGDVNLHSILVPVPEEDARQLFGDKLEVTLGTGPKTVYLAFGKDGLNLLKKSIDDCSAKAAQTNPPGQFNVYLKPIMQFAASMNPDNAMLQGLAANLPGNDEINIISNGIPGPAVRSRLTIKEGVLQLIGNAIRAASGGTGIQ